MPQTNELHATFGLLERELNANKCAGDDEDEFEEKGEEDGVLFYVNRGGFPVDDFTWQRMWNHVARTHPDKNQMTRKIKKNANLPDVAIPRAPTSFPLNTGIPERLDAIQKYMSQLQYNHTGTQLFEIKKNRPISGLMETAKEMIKESLPIKCLEAVILALHLTIGIPGLDRFPISFISTFNGNTHRHVVLGVYCLGKYGALGMSRRDDLMYKPLQYKSLSDLIKDYKASYEKYWHELKKVIIGSPVPHDPHSLEHINWSHLPLKLRRLSEEKMSRELDHHAREMRTQAKRWEALTTSYHPPVKMRPISTGDSPHPIRKSHTIASTNHRAASEPRQSKSKKQDVGRHASTSPGKSRNDSITVHRSSTQPLEGTHSVDQGNTQPRKLDTSDYQIRM